MSRCSADTVRGRPCRAHAVAGSDRCRAHQPLFDERTVEQLVLMLRAGNYPDVAARATGADLGGLPAGALERLVTARAEGEVRSIARIAQAAGENWQAAAWLLERQYPDRWGRPATRTEEKPPPPLAALDGLDELAGRRQVRRAMAP